jgi:hypothetical protein
VTEPRPLYCRTATGKMVEVPPGRAIPPDAVLLARESWDRWLNLDEFLARERAEGRKPEVKRS